MPRARLPYPAEKVVVRKISVQNWQRSDCRFRVIDRLFLTGVRMLVFSRTGIGVVDQKRRSS